jgi:hypothetical protein
VLSLLSVIACSSGSGSAPRGDGSTSDHPPPERDAKTSIDATSDGIRIDTTPASCRIAETYDFYFDGGEAFSTDRSRLGPERTIEVSRRYHTGAVGACSREIPCRDTGDAVTVPDILAAVANADVQAALARPTPPHYGNDPRPADGAIWVFRRSDGRGFSLGSSGDIPKGLRPLQTLLESVTRDTVELPRCASSLMARDGGTDAK